MPWSGMAAGMAAGKAGADGAVAQLGERLICNQEVAGSNPVSSTKSSAEFGVRNAELRPFRTPHSALDWACSSGG